MKKLLSFVLALVLLLPCVSLADHEYLRAYDQLHLLTTGELSWLITDCAKFLMRDHDSASDFSESYSDELLFVYDVVQQELVRRGLLSGSSALSSSEPSGTLSEVHIPTGEYIVGLDLPAGVYTFEVISEDHNPVLRVWDSEDKLLHRFNYYPIGSQLGDVIGKLELRNGELLEVKGDFSMKPYTGLAGLFD